MGNRSISTFFTLKTKVLKPACFMLLITTGLTAACTDPETTTPLVVPPMAGSEMAGTEVAACVSDSSCAPGTICNVGTGMCVPGQCSASTPCPANQTCNMTNFTCVADANPSCTSDANCSNGFCVAGMCRDVECVRDDNCGAGTRCDNMRCVADTSCIDNDGDGYGTNCGMGPDCDDRNRNVNPGAPENGATNCDDGIDNNCDGVDSICGSELDLDNDGFSDKDGDCDDMNPNINPGQMEIYYNDLDDDCNPQTNDDDQDGDGFAAQSSIDDNNAMVNPNMAEAYYNGIDDDCNEQTSDSDADGDGFDAQVVGGNDCNDDLASANPNAQEVPYNGVDDDCNASTPDNDLDGDGFTRDNDCNDDDANVNPDIIENASTNCSDGIDNNCVGGDIQCDAGAVDSDGDGTPDDQDCEPNNADVPGAVEIANNGIDDDCDGEVDNACIDDAFDDSNYNDGPANASAMDDYNGRYESLLVLCPNDTDWYQIRLEAGDGLEVDIRFEDALGDIDARLYRRNNGALTEAGLTVVDSSTSTNDNEVVYTARANVGDTYFIKVYQFGANPERVNYDMMINVFEGCQDDAVGPSGEHNDTLNEANNLPSFGENRQICDYDEDWYSFNLNRSQNIRIDTMFQNLSGDLDIELYNADTQTRVEASRFFYNNEVINIENLAAGNYALKVYGHNGSTNPYRVFLSSGASATAEFTDNADYDIPDGGDAPGVYTTPAIRFPAVPAGSIVRKLRIRQLDINHRCLGDLQVTLLWDGVPITTLWNRDGENCDDDGLDDDSLTSVGCNSLSGLLGRDICFENRYYPAYDENAPDQPLFQNGFDPMFAGLDAQGDLTVEIKDFVSGNVGKLVNLQVELEYFIP